MDAFLGYVFYYNLNMKKVINRVVDFVKKEWFLVIMLTTIAIILVLFDAL